MSLIESTEGGRAHQFAMPGAVVVTDALGRFAFAAAPEDGCLLRVGGKGVFDGAAPLPRARRGATVVVPRVARLHVRAHGLGGNRLDVRLLDANGEALVLHPAADMDLSIMLQPRRFLSLADGTCELRVPDTGRTLVLESEGVELVRRAVEPVAGAVVVVGSRPERAQ